MASWTALLTGNDGQPVSRYCRVAGTPLARARGLLGHKQFGPGEAMIFPGTRSVHTHFMRFAIDVVFLDGDGRMIRIAENVRPWRALSCRRARSVLELPAGDAARHGLRGGDCVELASPGERG
jgi:uncharacterized membrane protein (UPF0127 family)